MGFVPGSVEWVVGGLMLEPSANLAGRVLLLGGPQSKGLVINRTIDMAVHYNGLLEMAGMRTIAPPDEAAVERAISYLRDEGVVEGESMLSLTSQLGVKALTHIWDANFAMCQLEPYHGYR